MSEPEGANSTTKADHDRDDGTTVQHEQKPEHHSHNEPEDREGGESDTKDGPRLLSTEWWRKLKTNVRNLEPLQQVKGLAEFGLFVLAVIGGIAVLWQTQQTQETLTLTRDQIHKGQRAYVTADNAKLIEPLVLGKEQHASFKVHNSGQTPAVEVRHTTCIVLSDALPHELDAKVKCWGMSSMGSLGSDSDKTIFISRMEPLTANELREITDEEFSIERSPTEKIVKIFARPRLIVFGDLWYKDVFGGDGRTRYCFVYLKRSDGFVSCTGRNSFE